MSEFEAECPECGALIDISDIADYALICCYNCKKDLEKVGFELISEYL